MRRSLMNIVLFFLIGIPLIKGDTQCTSLGGSCQHDSNYCVVPYQSGLCSGGANRRCCIPGDLECASLEGSCQYTTTSCSVNYQSGLCAGPANRKCCIPGDAPCESAGGTCQIDTNSCSGSYQSGLCAGASNRRCCVPSSGSCPTIVSRSEWGARDPKDPPETMTTPVGRVFIHHTAGNTCSSTSSCASLIRGIQNFHMDTNNWNDIGYSFLVGGDGKIYEGRGWSTVGAHTSGYNGISIAISFIGNFMSAPSPTDEALTAAQNLIACGVFGSPKYVTSSYILQGHRDVGSTSCPGDELYSIIKGWSHYQAPP